MNKKVSLGVMISLIAVACAITFVLTMTVSLNMYNSMVAGIHPERICSGKFSFPTPASANLGIYA